MKRTRRLIVGYIYSSNYEGAHECNIGFIKLFGNIKLFKRSKLIVDYILIPSFEEAQQDAPAQQAASSTILKLIDALFFEVARVDLISTQRDSQLVVEYSKISHHFRKDCGIFCEGVKCQINNGLIGLVGLVRFIGLGLVGLIGCIRHNGLIGLVGLISLVGLGDFGIISTFASLDSAVSLAYRLIGLVGLLVLPRTISLVKNPPPAPGSLFLGFASRSASGRDRTRIPKPNSISGKPTSRSATRHLKKT